MQIATSRKEFAEKIQLAGLCSQKRYFGFRDITSDQVTKIEQLLVAKVGLKQISYIMTRDYSKDCTVNIVNCTKSKILEALMGKVDEDAHLTIKKHKDKQREYGELSVRFSHDINPETNQVTRLFYMSEEVLLNYVLYSRDVVILDTTFSQTKYR